MESLTASRSQAAILKRHLLPASTNEGLRVRIRFEQLLQIVRDTADKNLSTLKCLEHATTPTALHYFLARQAAAGAAVFTTNFDTLIERAYMLESSKTLLRVLDHESSNKRQQDSSFAHARNIAPTRQNHLLFKLHGSLRKLKYSRPGGARFGRWSTKTLNATLDTIGRGSVHPGLEANKEHLFLKCLSGRILIVIGYSGLDDFDVIPTMERAIRMNVLKGVLWISHCECDSMSITSWLNDRCKWIAQTLPSALTDVVRTKDPHAFVAFGRTTDIIESMFAGKPKCRSVFPIESSPSKVSNGLSIPMLKDYFPNTSTENARFTAARLCESAGDFSHADQLYQQAIVNSQRHSSRAALRIRGLATARRGYIQWLNGHSGRAFARMAQALTLLRRARDAKGIATVTNQLGLVYLNRGELRLALTYFHRALTLHRRHRDRARAAKSLANIGIVFRRLGDFDSAEKYAQRALAVSKSIRDREGMARDLGNLGNVFWGRKQYRLALKHHERAFRLARQIGQKQIMAVQTGNMGVCLRRLGRLSEALRTHQYALRLNREIGRTEGVHDATSEIGAVFGDLKKYTQSIQYLNKAINDAKKRGDVEGLAEDFESRGNVFAASGELRQARSDWLRSSKYFTQLGNHGRSAAVKSRSEAPISQSPIRERVGRR